MKRSFANTISIVTGGASGIGRELCIALGAAGSHIIVADINPDAARETAAAIHTRGGAADAVTLDITDAEAVQNMVHHTAASLGRIDYFFNNAAICVTGDMLDIGIEDYRRVIDVNLLGVMHGTMAAYGIMARQGGGHIVNISSMAGFAPFSMNTPYTTAKFGVRGFTDAIRHEAAVHGVRISLVCPGIVRSPFYQTNRVVGVDREVYADRLPSWALSPEAAARTILRGVAAGKFLIVFPFHARIALLVSRLAPRLFNALNRRLVREFRALRN